MILFLSYLLKVGACIVAFYLAYMALLSKETFFKLSRFVLLLSVIFSIVLPVWTMTITKEIVATQEFQQNIEVSNLTEPMQFNPDSHSNNWTDILPIIGLGVYILGALLFFTRNIFGILQIYRIMRRSRCEVTADGKLFIVRKAIIPFSWFRNIIISEEDYAKNRDIIIEHEKAHMRLKHGYDLLFINLIAIFQWFNPVIWLLRKELISIHEYQADSRVINKGIDAKKYQYLLISKGTTQCISIPVVNHLCSGNFKQRIKMMLKKQSNPHNAIKVLLLIPLLAGAVSVFAKTECVEVTPEANASENSNIAAMAQNLQKQDGFIYFVDGKEVSVDVIKTMSISDLFSYKIYKRDEAVEKFGEKAKNGAVDIITRAGRDIPKPPKDSKVKRDQVLIITINSDGSYLLGKWSDHSSDDNMTNATKSNIETVIKEIIPRMKYPKDSVIVSIKFENQVSLLERFEKLSPLEDVFKNNGIKNISVQIYENDSKKYQKAKVSPTIQNQELSNFKILIESTNGDIKLTGIKGCAFKELTFKLNDENSQAVDQFGMSTLDRDKPLKDKNLANFLFVLKKTKKGLALKGIEGTSWKELSFNSTENKCYQLIDQNGMQNISTIDSKRNTNSDSKIGNKNDIFSKSSESAILKFVFNNMIYPPEEKKSADSVNLYVIVKIDNGRLIECKFHTTKEGVKVPLLGELRIYAFKSGVNDVPEIKVDSEHTALKNEILRIVNKLAGLQIPEWKDKCVEFALPLRFFVR